MDVVHHRGQVRYMHETPAENQDDVRHHKRQKDWHEHGNRFLHTAQVHHCQENDRHKLHRQLVRLPRQRCETEDCIGTSGNRNRDGQNVVDQQRAAGNNAGRAAEQFGRDHVTTAAVREVLDDPTIRVRNDENRQRRCQREHYRQICMAAERQKCFGRSVGRGRQTVCAQPDPGEEGNQRNLVGERRVLQVARRAHQHAAGSSPQGLRQVRR